MSSDTALWTATALPDELLVLIVEACDGLADSHRIATLRSLCLVSKRLVIAAQKCLYSRIELPNHFTLVYRTLADAPHLARLVRSVSVAASDILYNVLAVQCALINVCDIVHATRHETTCEEAWDTVLAHSSLVSLTLSQSSLLDLISKPPTRPSEPIMARTRHLVCTPWVRLQTSRIGQSNYPRQLESLDLHETTNSHAPPLAHDVPRRRAGPRVLRLDPPRLPHLATLRVGGALARDMAKLDRSSGLGHKLWKRGIKVTTVQ
ncbi:uncharacterized protein JCM10292_005324 [Rhodotorula paludigena]|uniref:uncharacterized protein n=1 Tax=Rhodotorula paludigena TaxID=86838 RepID=UPI0031720561